jgi:ATP synthase protein I
MVDPADKERLAELEKRIDALKRTEVSKPAAGEKFSQANQAWRMIVELVVGIVIGTGIGYGLDVLFGTSPWFLVPFTLLGFAAGVNVMLQTAKELQQDNAAQSAAPDEDERD